MHRSARILLFLQLASTVLPALDFDGQVGRLDEAQLGMDWRRLVPGEFPILPLEGVRVSVLDCGEDCPDPVRTDPAGWFSFSDLASPSRLRFDPPECAADDPECEPLEPREVERASGARTALGAKWPRGIEDSMLRYMPSVDGALYVTRRGEIPGSPGAGGSASAYVVWSNFPHGHRQFFEYSTFIHELMHVYDLRLRLACWYENQEINGFVLHENWLRAYDADRARLTSLGLPLREPEGYNLSGEKRGLETLAWFADDYFLPDELVIEWRKEQPASKAVTHRELEQYAPNRYAFFEKIILDRYLKKKSWLRIGYPADDWPGMCRPPLNEGVYALDYLLAPPLPPKRSMLQPAGFKCGVVDLY